MAFTSSRLKKIVPESLYEGDSVVWSQSISRPDTWWIKFPKEHLSSEDAEKILEEIRAKEENKSFMFYPSTIQTVEVEANCGTDTFKYEAKDT
jgi:hypothetical protein